MLSQHQTAILVNLRIIKACMSVILCLYSLFADVYIAIYDSICILVNIRAMS